MIVKTYLTYYKQIIFLVRPHGDHWITEQKQEKLR